MIVLGITDTHDASACLIKNGKIVAAVQEERFQRIKGMGGYPKNAIAAILKEADITVEDIDHVAVATEFIVPANLHNFAATLTIKDHVDLNENYYYPILYNNQDVKITDVLTDFNPVGENFYPLEEISLTTSNEDKDKEYLSLQEFRRKYISKFLELSPEKIKFYDHHRCHAFYGYYSNPNRDDNTAVVTADSGGDGAYCSIGVFENGKYKLIERNHNLRIGKIYTQITLLLGMRPNEHEFKVMGMAPYATEYHKKGPREVFLNALEVDDLDFKKNPEMKDNYFYFKERLKYFRFDGISGGLQDFAEIRLKEWFNNIHQETNCRNICFTGGIANNVKANKVIIEQDWVDSFYVPPGPGDESLSLGAAYCALYEQKEEKEIPSFDSGYLGIKYSDENHKEFSKHSFIIENYERIENVDYMEVAKVLAQGEIVALLIGKMEFGARALGHRSLIADPSKMESVRKINDLIKKRDFWMPFTPSVLSEDYDKYVMNSKKIDSNYMTITFDSSEEGRDKLKGAVHPYDYTIRPQRVTKERNPVYHKVISSFKELSGIGAVLNTSLNIHGKPIVLQPTELLNEILLNGNIPLKYILIDSTFYKRK